MYLRMLPYDTNEMIYKEAKKQNIHFTIFRRIRKIAKSDYQLRHVCPSVRMEQLGSNWTDFDEIRFLKIFRKSAHKIQFSLKSDKNNRYFRWRLIDIFHHISLSSS